MVLRRSPRFHVEDKSLGKPLLPPNRLETPPNRKSKSAHLKDKNQESLKSDRRNAGLEPLARMKRQNEPQLLCQDSRGITPRKNIADVSNKKSEKKEELTPQLLVMYVCVVASSNPQNQTKSESLLHDFHFLPKMRVYNNAGKKRP